MDYAYNASNLYFFEANEIISNKSQRRFNEKELISAIGEHFWRPSKILSDSFKKTSFKG
jgi:hypothetical protein